MATTRRSILGCQYWTKAGKITWHQSCCCLLITLAEYFIKWKELYCVVASPWWSPFQRVRKKLPSWKSRTRQVRAPRLPARWKKPQELNRPKPSLQVKPKSPIARLPKPMDLPQNHRIPKITGTRKRSSLCEAELVHCAHPLIATMTSAFDPNGVLWAF